MRDLLAAADFGAVQLRIAVVSVRFGSPRHFLEAEALSSPLADPVRALDAAARNRLAADVDEALAPHTDDQGLRGCSWPCKPGSCKHTVLSPADDAELAGPSGVPEDDRCAGQPRHDCSAGW
jgi:hypothetical protein